MKLVAIFFVCFAFLLLAGIKSSEAQENFNQLDEMSQGLYDGGNEALVLNRQKRGTCNISPALCATHCRLRGYKRSFCSRQKICNCRR